MSLKHNRQPLVLPKVGNKAYNQQLTVTKYKGAPLCTVQPVGQVIFPPLIRSNGWCNAKHDKSSDFCRYCNVINCGKAHSTSRTAIDLHTIEKVKFRDKIVNVDAKGHKGKLPKIRDPIESKRILKLRDENFEELKPKRHYSDKVRWLSSLPK